MQRSGLGIHAVRCLIVSRSRTLRRSDSGSKFLNITIKIHGSRMAYLQQARCERQEPVEMPGKMSEYIGQRVLKQLYKFDAREGRLQDAVIGIGNCQPKQMTRNQKAAFELVVKLLELAQEISVSHEKLKEEQSDSGTADLDTFKNQLCYITRTFAGACETTPSLDEVQLLQYAYILLTLLEQFDGHAAATTTDLKVRELFDAVHGLLSPESMTLQEGWKTKRGDDGYIAEVSAKLRAFFMSMPSPPRLECTEMGCGANGRTSEAIGAISMNPPQRIINFLVNPSTGPEDQRLLVVMRPGLGKSIVALTVFYNYFDPENPRPMMLCASSDELLSNIRSEAKKVGKLGIIPNYNPALFEQNYVVFCDFRYKGTVDPGIHDFLFTNGSQRADTLDEAWDVAQETQQLGARPPVPSPSLQGAALKDALKKACPPGWSPVLGELPVGINHDKVKEVLSSENAVIVIDEAQDLKDLDDANAVKRNGAYNAHAKTNAEEFRENVQDCPSRVVIALSGSPFSDDAPRAVTERDLDVDPLDEKPTEKQIGRPSFINRMFKKDKDGTVRRASPSNSVDVYTDTALDLPVAQPGDDAPTSTFSLQGIKAALEDSPDNTEERRMFECSLVLPLLGEDARLKLEEQYESVRDMCSAVTQTLESYASSDFAGLESDEYTESITDAIEKMYQALYSDRNQVMTRLGIGSKTNLDPVEDLATLHVAPQQKKAPPKLKKELDPPAPIASRTRAATNRRDMSKDIEAAKLVLGRKITQKAFAENEDANSLLAHLVRDAGSVEQFEQNYTSDPQRILKRLNLSRDDDPSLFRGNTNSTFSIPAAVALAAQGRLGRSYTVRFGADDSPAPIYEASMNLLEDAGAPLQNIHYTTLDVMNSLADLPLSRAVFYSPYLSRENRRCMRDSLEEQGMLQHAQRHLRETLREVYGGTHPSRSSASTLGEQPKKKKLASEETKDETRLRKYEQQGLYEIKGVEMPDEDRHGKTYQTSAGLTKRGDALARMIVGTKDVNRPWRWAGCMLTANYYEGTNAFLELTPALGKLPSLKGTEWNRAVDLIQVDLSKSPKPPKTNFKTPDAKYKESFNCKAASVPFLKAGASENRAQFDRTALLYPESLIPKLDAAANTVLKIREGLPILEANSGGVVFQSIEAPIECVTAQGLVTFRTFVSKKKLLFNTLGELRNAVGKPETEFVQGKGNVTRIHVIESSGEEHVLPEATFTDTELENLVSYDPSEPMDMELKENYLIALPYPTSNDDVVIVRNSAVESFEVVTMAVDRVMTFERPSSDMNVFPVVLYERIKSVTSVDYFEAQIRAPGKEPVTVYFRNHGRKDASYLPRQMVMIAADEGFELLERLIYAKYTKNAKENAKAKYANASNSEVIIEKAVRAAEIEIKLAVAPLIVPLTADTKARTKAIESFEAVFNGSFAQYGDIPIAVHQDASLLASKMVKYARLDTLAALSAASEDLLGKKFDAATGDLASQSAAIMAAAGLETNTGGLLQVQAGDIMYERKACQADIAIIEANKFSTGLDVTGCQPEGNARPLGCSYLLHVTEVKTAVQCLQRTLRVSRFCRRRFGRVCRIIMFQVIGGSSGIADCSKYFRKNLEASLASLFGGSADHIGLLQRFQQLSVDSGIQDLMTTSAASAILAGATFLRRSFAPRLGNLGGMDAALLSMFGEFVTRLNDQCQIELTDVRTRKSCTKYDAESCPKLACLPMPGAKHPCIRRIHGSVCAGLGRTFGAFSSWMQQLDSVAMLNLLKENGVARPLWSLLKKYDVVKIDEDNPFEIAFAPTSEKREKEILKEADRLQNQLRHLLYKAAIAGRNDGKAGSEKAYMEAVYSSTPKWLAVALVGEQYLRHIGARLQFDETSLRSLPPTCAALLALLYGIGQKLHSPRKEGYLPSSEASRRINAILDKINTSLIRQSAIAAGIAFTASSLAGSDAETAAKLGGFVAASQLSAHGGSLAMRSAVERAQVAMHSAADGVLRTKSDVASWAQKKKDRAYGWLAGTESKQVTEDAAQKAATQQTARPNLPQATSPPIAPLLNKPRTGKRLTLTELYEEQLHNGLDWASDPIHLFVPILAVQLFALRTQQTLSFS